MKCIFLLCILILSAEMGFAQPAIKDSVEEITLDTLTVSVPAGPQPYRASAARVWEIAHTRIALSFDRKEKTAGVHEWITLHPYFYPADSVLLDAKGVHIDSVLLSGKKGNTPLRYTYRNDELKIHFDKTYKATDTVELYLVYTAMPYGLTSGGSNAISDDRGLYFINTDYKIPHKPAQIWTQGETESNSHWMITIDHPNSRFTTQVELTVPDSFTTLSNGAIVRQVKGTGGLRTDIWRMDMPIQAYVVMFAIGKFSVIKDHWKTKEVNYYVEPEYAPYASQMFKNTPEMIDYFSQVTGVPFPWNKYSQVVVRDYVSGAMENTSAALFGEFMNQNTREMADRSTEDIVSHELFHEWFGDYATCESWSNLTVNESFANYGEQLWRTHKYGKDAGEELAFEDLQGQTGYIPRAEANDPPLVRFYYDSREDMFDHISYNKGGGILRYMNTLMGDAAFSRAMYLYLTKNALHSTEAHQWRLAVEEATGQDWNWFFNQWYFHGGHPVLKVAYNYSDSQQKLIVTVTQVQTDSTFLYQLPLKTALICGNSKTILDWNITKQKETFSYDYKNGQRPVIIPDYTHVLPGELKDGKKPEEWIIQFTQAEDYVSKRLALTAAGRLLSDSVSQEIVDVALKDRMNSIRRQALSVLRASQNDKYHKRWTAKVAAMAVSDSSNAVRAMAFNVLADWKVGTEKQEMFNALHDSSYAVAGAALEGINKLDKDTAYLLSKQLLPTDPKMALANNIWSIIGKKGEDADITLFERYAWYFSGAMKFTMASALSNYLKNVKSEESFSLAVDLYTKLVILEDMKQYRSMFGGYLFSVASEEKTNLKSEKKEEADSAKKRMDILKTALQKVVAAESDPETAKDFEHRMKSNFD